MTQLACRGFLAASVAAGIKKIDRLDMGLIYAESPASVAGVFTRNRVRAAPVLLCQERVAAGRCQAVVANSGNANCCTGDRGMEDARTTAREVARSLGIDESLVCVCSTGVIGQFMPMDRISAGVPPLAKALRPDGFEDFAKAILTTDLVSKTSVASGEAGGRPYTILGVAKGSGMIRPDMATMLCFVVTDAAVEPGPLQSLLSSVTERTFNRISVDGDTSTNDTILVMASGASGAVVKTEAELARFGEALNRVLGDLARQVVRDGEGATKVVEIRVTGAASEADALRVADTVAHSNLVKTALFGQDANWGRIIAAAGRSGVAIDPDRVAIDFGGCRICVDGRYAGPEAEAAVAAVLKEKEYVITIDLGMGGHEASMLTCDFSYDYVRINADYRS